MTVCGLCEVIQELSFSTCIGCVCRTSMGGREIHQLTSVLDEDLWEPSLTIVTERGESPTVIVGLMTSNSAKRWTNQNGKERLPRQ